MYWAFRLLKKVARCRYIPCNLSEVWSTPRLNSFVYDMAREKPKDGKPGLLTLGSGSPDGKSRVIYFFASLKD